MKSEIEDINRAALARQPVRIMHLSLGDEANDTDGFTLEHEGFYLRLRRSLYVADGRLPDDDARNARRFKVDIRVYGRLKSFLLKEGKIEINNGHVVCPRVLRELEAIKARRDTSAEYGRMGADTRKSKADQGGGSGRLPADCGPTSPELPAEVPDSKAQKSCGFNVATMASPSPSPSPKEAAQQEDGAGRVPAALRLDLRSLSERLLSIAEPCLANQAKASGLAAMTTPCMWLDQGCDLERDVVPTLTEMAITRKGKGVRSWDYFTAAIAEAKDKRLAGFPNKNIQPSADVLPFKVTTLMHAKPAPEPDHVAGGHRA